MFCHLYVDTDTYICTYRSPPCILLCLLHHTGRSMHICGMNKRVNKQVNEQASGNVSNTHTAWILGEVGWGALQGGS